MWRRISRVVRRTIAAVLLVAVSAITWGAAGALWDVAAHVVSWQAALATLQHDTPLLRLVETVSAALALSIVLAEFFSPLRWPIVIAVDGSAVSGRGLLAKQLAAHFGFAHLDAGSLYRLVALTVVDAGGNPAKKSHAVKAARRIDPSRCNDPAVRSEKVGRAAMQVAKFEDVRRQVRRLLREFTRHPPNGAAGVVVDGHDIGTLVAPKATAKLYLSATPEICAHHCWQELSASGYTVSKGEILAGILARDEAGAPCEPARDAKLLDTSGMDAERAFAAALALVEPAVESARQTRGCHRYNK